MNKNLHNKTADKGWTAMRALLDKEMPVEQKRRPIWWWLVLLLIPLSIYGALQFGGFAEFGKNPDNGKAHQEMAGTVQDANSPIIRSKSDNQTSINECVISRKSSVVGHQNPDGDLSRPELNFESSTKFETGNDSPNIETIIAKKAIPENLAMVETEQSVAVSNVEPLPVIPALIDTDNQIPAELITIEAEPVQAVESPKRVSEKKWSLGATLGASGEQFIKTSGYSAGATAQWTGRHKWGLRSGLHFRLFYPANNTTETARLRSGQYAAVAGSGYVLVDGTGNELSNSVTGYIPQGEIELPVTRMYIVELPVLLSWKPARNFNLFGGLGTDFILSVKTKNEGLIGDSNKLIANSIADVRSLNSLAINDIDRWRFNIQTGLAFNVANSWELALMAKLPIKKPLFESKAEADALSSPDPMDQTNAPQQKSQISCSISATYYFAGSRK